MQRISIPRWLLLAMAALLVIAIFAIVIHPYYDVSKATVGERVMLIAAAALVLLASRQSRPLARVFLAEPPQPRPLPVVDRTCIRRI